MTLRSGFTLGNWTVYPLEGRLVRDGEQRRIQPKSMDVLLCLAEAGGAVVERENLLTSVWGDRAPSDEPLTRCIGELRKAFGDTRSQPEYILTVPKRGYQLKQPAVPLAADNYLDDVEAPPLTERQSRKRMDTVKKIVAAAALLLIAALAEITIERLLESPIDEQNQSGHLLDEIVDADRSIVVLPFANVSADEEQEYISDGISEELLMLLAQVDELRVISRSSAFSYKNKNLDIPTIAKQLQVSFILEGSVRKSGDQVRVMAQLIDARSDAHIWSETYDRTIDDVFAMQDDIAAKVVDELKIELLSGAPTSRATDPDAYDLVLQARYVGRQFTPGALEKSVELLEQALEIDPGNATAWAQLSRGYRRQASQGMRTYDEAYALARDAANRALFIDSSNVAALRGLAFIARNYDRDLATAAVYYKRAFELDPADSVTIRGAASLAESMGRPDQAILLAERALAADPVSPLTSTYLGLVYLHAGRSEEAINLFRITLTLSPGYIGMHHLIGLALLHQGELDAALEETAKEQDVAYRLIGSALIYHAMGDTEKSDIALRSLIDEFEHDTAYNIAFTYAFRGQADQAFDWLQKAVEYNDTGLSEIVVDPLFDNIRTDDRWLPFLESIERAPAQLDAIEFDIRVPGL